MMRVRDRRRSYASKYDRPLRETDLIPLTTALEMLTVRHGRKYTLADFQLEAIQGHNMCTPVFNYTGRGVIFNPNLLATNDLLEKCDGWIPDGWYESFYHKWWHSEQQILNVNNHFFCLDFGGMLGLEIGVLNNFTEYLINPQARIPAPKIRPALYISGASVNTGEFMVMPVVDYPHNQPIIKPKEIEPNFNISLYV